MLENTIAPKNWIALTLENVSSEHSSVINLFDIGIDYSGSTKWTSGVVTFVAGNPANWNVRTTETGTLFFTGNYQTIDDVIDAFNEEFTEDGLGIMSYETVTSTTFRIVAYSTEYNFISVTPNLAPAKVFTSSTSQVASGSTVVVDSESSISMNTLTQELVYQPYKLLSVNVYANDIDQANKTFELIDKNRSGKLLKTFSYPTVNPIQNQFALEDVKLEYLPSATNQLRYTLDPSESVRLILKYEHAEELLNEDNQLVLLGSSENTDVMTTRYIQVKNPMIGLVLKQDKAFTPIAKIVGEYVNEEEGMTYEQFYSAFDGNDFASNGANPSH
jgi:hypothetical protein